MSYNAQDRFPQQRIIWSQMVLVLEPENPAEAHQMLLITLKSHTIIIPILKTQKQRPRELMPGNTAGQLPSQNLKPSSLSQMPFCLSTHARPPGRSICALSMKPDQVQNTGLPFPRTHSNHHHHLPKRVPLLLQTRTSSSREVTKAGSALSGTAGQ